MINDPLMKLGSFGIRLTNVPKEVLKKINHFGHIAVAPAELRVEAYEDEFLGIARYAGVVRMVKRNNDESVDIEGSGMSFWLGDEDDKGAVIEDQLSFNGSTFANAIRNLIPTSLTEGTLHSVAGTYNGRHRYQTPRQAIDYVCDTFGAEWRVNPNGSIDAGEASDLFVSEPKTIIARKGVKGYDFDMRGLEGEIETDRNADDFSTRVILLAEGEGPAISSGSADIIENPYLDLQGNPVKFTRIISESETSTGNATARAQLQLNRFINLKRGMTLDASDFDIEGSFKSGDFVWVYDPDNELFDTENEVHFRGMILNPVPIRVLGIDYPISKGMTVAYRSQTGEWIDLTEYVQWEDGDTTVHVGRLPRGMTSEGQPVQPRVNFEPPTSNSTIPGKPTFNVPFSMSNYIDSEGKTRTKAIITWNMPLNTDGSTITDGAYYQIRWRALTSTWTGSTGTWEDDTTLWDGSGSADALFQTTQVGWGVTELEMQDLAPGVVYEVAIAAYDVFSKTSGYSDLYSFTALADVTPPSTPAAPLVAGNPLYIQVTHLLGKADGGTYNLESDLARLEVHVGTDAGFTTGTNTLVGFIVATVGNINQEVPAIQTFENPTDEERFVKVIAVDTSGNRSLASEAATVTSTLIDTQHITNLSVTTAKIANLAVTNAKVVDLNAEKITAGFLSADRIESGSIFTDKLVVGHFDNLIMEPSFERDNTSPHWVGFAGGVAGVWSVSSTVFRSGERSIRYAPNVSQPSNAILQLNGAGGAEIKRHVKASEGDAFYFEIYVRPGGDGPWNNIRINFSFRNILGSEVGSSSKTMTVGPGLDVPANTWTRQFHIGTVPAGATYVIPQVLVLTNGETSPFNFDDAYMRRRIGTAVIEDLAVTTAKIDELAVTNAKINSLSANKITAGTIGAHVINLDGSSSLIQSLGYVDGASGWRISGSGNAWFNSVTVRGNVQASTITGSSITTENDGKTIDLRNERIRFSGTSTGNFDLSVNNSSVIPGFRFTGPLGLDFRVENGEFWDPDTGGTKTVGRIRLMGGESYALFEGAVGTYRGIEFVNATSSGRSWRWNRGGNFLNLEQRLAGSSSVYSMAFQFGWGTVGEAYFTPTNDEAVNLGFSDKRWRNFWARSINASQSITAGQHVIVGNQLQFTGVGRVSTTSNEFRWMDPSGSNFLDFKGNDFIVMSDPSVKSEISEYSGKALPEVINTKVYEFNYNDKHKIGFMADEVPAVARRGEAGDMGIATHEMNAILWKAVQELNERLDGITKLIKEV